MGILDWVQKTAMKALGGVKTVTKGVDWLNQKVGKPVYGLLKSVPVVGQVAQAAEPIYDAASKNLSAAAGTGRAATNEEWTNAAKSALPGLVKAGAAAYAGR